MFAVFALATLLAAVAVKQTTMTTTTTATLLTGSVAARGAATELLEALLPGLPQTILPPTLLLSAQAATKFSEQKVRSSSIKRQRATDFALERR